MVVLRLRREGTKNRPFFRIVAADQRFKRDGRFLEILGHYDPLKEGDNVVMKLDRAQHWIDRGAQPSDTVRQLMKKAKKSAPAAEAVAAE